MDKIEALEQINQIWNNKHITLGEKITSISNNYYDVGLDLSTTAEFIKATPAELDALLSLGGLDEDIIKLISKADPPKTIWPLLANASEEEINQALNAFVENKKKDRGSRTHSAISEFIYKQMIDVAGPTQEQLVGMLTGAELSHAQKKASDFHALSEKSEKFLRSIIGQRKRGKTLSSKQIDVVISILNDLVDQGVIKRNSIDGDSEICDKILDAIGR